MHDSDDNRKWFLTGTRVKLHQNAGVVRIAQGTVTEITSSKISIETSPEPFSPSSTPNQDECLTGFVVAEFFYLVWSDKLQKVSTRQLIRILFDDGECDTWYGSTVHAAFSIIEQVADYETLKDRQRARKLLLESKIESGEINKENFALFNSPHPIHVGTPEKPVSLEEIDDFFI